MSLSLLPNGLVSIVDVSHAHFEHLDGPCERIRGARSILEDASPQDVLAWAARIFDRRVALACSFGGPSGMVLIDMLAEIDAKIPVYYLDTGLLFPETYALIDRTRQRYGIEPIAAHPSLSVEEQATLFGPALWSRDPDSCCEIRKLAPQRRLLSDYEAWISGIRRDQSPQRSDVAVVESDTASGLTKINPLASWTGEMVWTYIRAHDVPYNELHDRGYPSLGCTHCTSPVKAGEHERAGRWRGFAKSECGLHR